MLVPVSSTVIPLDDLPQYRVGVGVGVVAPVPGKFRPDGPVKLITSEYHTHTHTLYILYSRVCLTTKGKCLTGFIWSH